MQRRFRSALVGAIVAAALSPLVAQAHGDVTPQAVDTRELQQLGAEWLQKNPYTGDAKAIAIGKSAFNQNCARCHGLEAISGGIAPDLRKLDNDCVRIAQPARKTQCLAEVDQYFTTTVRNGRTRNGAVYMPPFEGVLSQEAVWSIRSYLDTRRASLK